MSVSESTIANPKKQLEFYKDLTEQLQHKLEFASNCKYIDVCDELQDCTREEYNNMCECNMKLSVDNVDLQERITKAIKYINDNRDYQDVHKQIGINEFIDTTEDILDEEHIKELLSILEGEDK